MASLGTLSVDLIASTGGFTKGMDKAQRRTKQFDRNLRRFQRKVSRSFGNITRLIKRLSLLFVGLVASAGAVIAKFTGMAESLGDVADQTGAAASEIQVLHRAAGVAGTSITNLDSSLTKYVKRIGKAQNDTGAAVNALERMGVSADDLSKISLTDQLALLMDRLNGVEDSATRAALADGLFGESWRTMIPFIEAGSEGIRNARERIEKLGITITDDGVNKAAEMRSEFRKLAFDLKGTVMKAVVDLAPEITKLANKVSEFIGSFDSTGINTFFNNVIHGFHNSFRALKPLLTAMAAYQGLLAGGKLGKNFLSALAGGGVGAVGSIIGLNMIDEKISKLDPIGQVEDLKALIKTRNAKIAESYRQGDMRLVKQLAKQNKETYEKIQKIKDRLVEPTSSSHRKPRPDSDRSGEQNGSINNNAASIASRRGDLYVQIMGYLDDEADKTQRLVQLNDSLATSQQRIEKQYQRRKQQILALIPPGEQRAAAMKRNFEMMQDSLASLKNANGEMSQYSIQAARDTQQAFADFLFDPFQDGLKGMVQGFAKALRRMAANAAASQIFEGIKGQGSGSLWSGIASIVGSAFGGGGVSTASANASMANAGITSNQIASRTLRFANGGRPPVGQASLVGERGPELFVPQQAGTIVPNHAMGGSVTYSPTINVEYAEAEGKTSEERDRDRQQFTEQLRTQVLDVMMQDLSQRGSVSRGYAQVFNLKRGATT